MPTFAAAFSNLGATLGELDRPEAAAEAFQRALVHDPDNFTVLNNVGVVCRELGRLDESERALVRVTELAPEFVFGHYNLGHTRFLRGDYAGALREYEEGHRRDATRDRRQSCRLAIVRFAVGDLDAATRELWRAVDAAPADEREDLLLEALEITTALLHTHPEWNARRAFVDRIASELTV
jgi:Flp pilus assembly protein TadD